MKRIIMTALLAGALSTAGTVYAADTTGFAPCNPPQGAPGPMGSSGPAMGPRMGSDMGSRMAPGMRSMRRNMKQMLGLSDKQESRMLELRQAFFRQSAASRQELFRLQHDLASESLQNRPDERKLSALVEQIGHQHAQLAAIESRHLRELTKVLSRKQIDTMLNMREEFRARHWKGKSAV